MSRRQNNRLENTQGEKCECPEGKALEVYYGSYMCIQCEIINLKPVNGICDCPPEDILLYNDKKGYFCYTCEEDSGGKVGYDSNLKQNSPVYSSCNHSL